MFDNREPDAINELGVKYWVEKTSTQYAKSLKLENIIVFRVLFPDNKQAYLITQNQKPIHETQSFEGIGCFLDIMVINSKI
jgi:hypothetical protein